MSQKHTTGLLAVVVVMAGTLILAVVLVAISMPEDKPDRQASTTPKTARPRTNLSEPAAARRPLADANDSAGTAPERGNEDSEHVPGGLNTPIDEKTTSDRGQLLPPTERRQPSTEEIVAKCEPSVARVSGSRYTGSGFLARPGLVATNEHVIDNELSADLQVSFPSAPPGRRGPWKPRVVHIDSKVDLALLQIPSDLPPLELAADGSFRKGEEITIIGSPGRANGVFENAISRGVMSVIAQLGGQLFYQMNASANPGNSGGPVLNSGGSVIGVLSGAPLDSMGQVLAGMALAIPVEELHAAIRSIQATPEPATVRTRRDQGRSPLVRAAPRPFTPEQMEAIRVRAEKARGKWEQARAQAYRSASLVPGGTLSRRVPFDFASRVVFDVNRKYCRGQLWADEAMRVKNRIKQRATMRWARWLVENVGDLVPPGNAPEAGYPASLEALVPDVASVSWRRVPVTIAQSWHFFTRKLDQAGELPADWKTE